MLFDVNIEPITFITELIKIFFISICTYYTFLKITNINMKNIKLGILNIFINGIISIIITIIKYYLDFLISRICLVFLMSLSCSLIYKNEIGNSILINTISLSINYMLFFIAIVSSYILNKIINIKQDEINLIIMCCIHLYLLFKFGKTKKIKNGISYLKNATKDDFLNIVILNISVIISFSFIIFSKISNLQITKNLFIAFFIFIFIMIFTIKKSIEAYYKQKLLIQDLNETKKELEEKKKEIEELEAENLNFSKKSHSLAHKQKSLEFKINKLLMNSENAKELGIENELKNLSKELYENSKLPQLEKTGITEIDDMLSVMQEECRINGIDFNLQLKGNIYQMTNHFVTKEELSILLADHIKDAIIAINHSDNINKSIMVRLGKLDENFGLFIYDSGVEFSKKVLESLGKKPITTYPNEGGTGMGFMNTFDTLKRHNASLIIESIGKPSKDNYTKVVKIVFDNKYQKIYK